MAGYGAMLCSRLACFSPSLLSLSLSLSLFRPGGESRGAFCSVPLFAFFFVSSVSTHSVSKKIYNSKFELSQFLEILLTSMTSHRYTRKIYCTINFIIIIRYHKW
jgi:hypothetical protein